MRAEIIILNSKDKKIIRQTLDKQFGINEIPSDIIYFCLNKKERVYAANREIFDIEQESLRVNAFGLYFGTYMVDGFRLSLEGSQMIGPLATKNIFSISNSQFEDYLKGLNISCEVPEFQKQYVLVKHDNDFLGVAKIKNNILNNHLPKSRRLKKVFNSEETCESDC